MAFNSSTLMILFYNSNTSHRWWRFSYLTFELEIRPTILLFFQQGIVRWMKMTPLWYGSGTFWSHSVPVNGFCLSALCLGAHDCQLIWLICRNGFRWGLVCYFICLFLLFRFFYFSSSVSQCFEYCWSLVLYNF